MSFIQLKVGCFIKARSFKILNILPSWFGGNEKLFVSLHRFRQEMSNALERWQSGRSRRS